MDASTGRRVLGGRVLGERQRRIDGRAKLTGRARFTEDLRIAGLAYARLVLSPHPAARIVAVDLAAARRAPGVLAAVSGTDLPAVPAGGADLPLARDRVYFAGQPVAAVVAESEAAAADAAELLRVEYEADGALIDPLDAMRDDAHAVLDKAGAGLDCSSEHGGGDCCGEPEPLPANVAARTRFDRGDAEAALRDSAVVVDRRYVIPAVHQGFVEPHVAVAAAGPDGELTIWAPTQGPFLTRRVVANQLGLPVSRVRVVPMAVGGGFGGKMCLVEPLVALLARLVERPVRLALTRTEEFAMGRGAPSCSVELRLGAGLDGELTGLVARVVYDHGARRDDYGAVTGVLLGGTYRLRAYDITTVDVVTNKTPSTAYRAPGGPQASFALESAIDELACRLGLDPVELRIRNASREGDIRPDGQPWPRIGLLECLEAARRRLAEMPRAAGEGVGVAVGAWDGSYEPAAATCKLEPDGTLWLEVGTVDVSGTHTTLAAIAADTFGVPPERVRVEAGDTRSAQYGATAGGSKVVYSVGPAVRQAAAEARARLLAIASEELEAAACDLTIEDGQVRVVGAPGRARDIGELADLGARFLGGYEPVCGQGRSALVERSPMFTVQLGRARIDAETGAAHVVGYAAVQDVGRALNPAAIEGQVHGGVLQCLGRALGEELVWDAAGQLRTASFADYGIPTIDQAPEIDVELVEVPSPHGPFGARGVGEPPAVPGAAVVANALSAAAGVRITALPLTPEAVARAGWTGPGPRRSGAPPRRTAEAALAAPPLAPADT